MKVLRIISSIIIGLVFMFSGIVKAIDPSGTGYKFNDYFQAFDLGFFKPVSLILAVILFTAEFISGFAVLSGYRRKEGIWGVMLLLIIFTPLTFILALTNPVSDCGCFGDAIHLTNWQTFWKNVVLSIFTLILFAGRKKTETKIAPAREWSVITVVTVLLIGFALLNLRYLQIVDFLPYKKGVNIPEAMKIPEGMPADQYESTFVYEKDGVRKEFTLENYPAGDTTWKFIDQNTVLVKKGYVPPVHDFSITAPDGQDIAGQVLSSPGYTLIMISTKLKDADPAHLAKGFELGVHCMTAGISFLILTSSGSDELSRYNNGFTFFTGDETTLKTIVRSNPGYVLLKGGVVQGKWSAASLPAKENFMASMTPEHIKKMSMMSPVLIYYTISISVILLVLLISSLVLNGKEGNEV